MWATYCKQQDAGSLFSADAVWEQKSVLFTMNKTHIVLPFHTVWGISAAKEKTIKPEQHNNNKNKTHLSTSKKHINEQQHAHSTKKSKPPNPKHPCTLSRLWLAVAAMPGLWPCPLSGRSAFRTLLGSLCRIL